MEKLVSILTPCYNGEKYIWRLLNSILLQTYSKIEMFVIDDGSTDNSEKLIKSYIPKFEAKGYSLTYIYQENCGLSGTINNGLKLITGDFLVWPDCDDWYAENDAIQQMVTTLDNSNETVSMVRCQSYSLDENTLKIVGRFCVNKKTRGKTDLFEDCMFKLNGYWMGAGNYLIKIIKLEKTIPHKEIYTDKNAGQNFQLMLPLLYRNQCLTIEKYLYNILKRKNSHSRKSTLEQKLQLCDSVEKTQLITIDNIMNMPIAEKVKYRYAIQNMYNKRRFDIFIFHKKFKKARNVFFDLDIVYKKNVLAALIKIIIRKIFKWNFQKISH